jgi:hypothetical protein
MLAEDKAGIARIKFRVAGTAHIQDSNDKEWKKKLAKLKEKRSAELKIEDDRKKDKKQQKDAIARAKALAQRVLIQQQEVHAIAALEERAKRAQRRRNTVETVRSNAKLSIILAAANILEDAEFFASIGLSRSPPASAGANSLRKSLRKRKQLGGYRHKTFKQRGGTKLSISTIEKIIHDRLANLIHGVYNNLYHVLLNDTRSTSLFNVFALDNNDFIDMSLIGVNRGYIFLDNPLLGLPLGKIIYMLYDNLYDLTEISFTAGEEELHTHITSLIDDFLLECNF